MAQNYDTITAVIDKIDDRPLIFATRMSCLCLRSVLNTHWRRTHQLWKGDGQYTGLWRIGIQLLQILLAHAARTPVNNFIFPFFISFKICGSPCRSQQCSLVPWDTMWIHWRNALMSRSGMLWKRWREAPHMEYMHKMLVFTYSALNDFESPLDKVC